MALSDSRSTRVHVHPAVDFLKNKVGAEIYVLLLHILAHLVHVWVSFIAATDA